MTMKRYNYLPHPISEYGPFRSRPDDDATMLLARKDQAAWNFGYLLYPPRYDIWLKASALLSNQEAIALDACFLMHYKVNHPPIARYISAECAAPPYRR